MQHVLGRLAAQFLAVEGAGKVEVTVTVPAVALAGAESAPPLEPGFAQSSHKLLGEQRIQDFLVIAFCAAFSLIGWLMILQGVEQIQLTRAVLQWPTTEGIIESADVYPVEGSQGERWRPQVRYSYAVGGRVVTATRLSLGKAPIENRQSAAERYLTKYRPGSTVKVFFNQRELTESVLDVSTPISVYVNLAFGWVVALVGPALLILFRFWPSTRALPQAGTEAAAA